MFVSNSTDYQRFSQNKVHPGTTEVCVCVFLFQKWPLVFRFSPILVSFVMKMLSL